MNSTMHSHPTQLTAHPALDVWPVSDDTARQLVSSIENHGFDRAHPILVWRDQIVDGRLRLNALNALGITPKWGVHLVALDANLSEGDIWMVCGRANGVRRNLSKSQRATCAVPYLPHYEVDARERMLAGKAVDGTKGEAAELLGDEWGVSASMIRLARRLSNEASDLFVKVKDGALTMNAAIKQLDIRQGKREPDNPRFNVRYDAAHQPMVEDLIAYYKRQGTSLNKRLLELLAQDHARIQAGVWQQSEQQRRVAGVLSELDPDLAAQVSPPAPVEDTTEEPNKEAESKVIKTPSATLIPPVNRRGVAPDPSLKSTEGHPEDALDGDVNLCAGDEAKAPVQVGENAPIHDGTTDAEETTERAISKDQIQRLIDHYNAVAEQWNRTRGVVYARYRQQMLGADVPLPEIIKRLCPTYSAKRIAFTCKQINQHPGPDILKFCQSKPSQALMERLLPAWQAMPDEDRWFKALDALLELPAGPLLHGHLRTFTDLLRPPRTDPGTLFLWKLEGYRTWNFLQEPEPSGKLMEGSPVQSPSTQQPEPEASTSARIERPRGEVAANAVRPPYVPVSPPQTMSVRLDHEADDALPFKAVMEGITERMGHSIDTPQRQHHGQTLASPREPHSVVPFPAAPELTPAHTPFEPSPGVSKSLDDLDDILRAIPHPDALDQWDRGTLNRLSTRITKGLNNGRIISDQDAQRAYDIWRKGMREGDPQSNPPPTMGLSTTLRIKRRLGCTRDGNHARLLAAFRLAGQQGVSISRVLETQIHTEAWIKLAAHS